jgi:hypothetical protein
VYVRKIGRDGRAYVDFLVSIMRGEPLPLPKWQGKSLPRPTIDLEILLDRGWGRAKEFIELSGETSPAERLELLRHLSDDERATMRVMLQKAIERAQQATLPPAPSEPTPPTEGDGPAASPAASTDTPGGA